MEQTYNFEDVMDSPELPLEIEYQFTVNNRLSTEFLIRNQNIGMDLAEVDTTGWTEDQIQELTHRKFLNEYQITTKTDVLDGINMITVFFEQDEHWFAKELIDKIEAVMKKDPYSELGWYIKESLENSTEAQAFKSDF